MPTTLTLSMDQTPIKPFRRSSSIDDMSADFQLLFPPEEENDADYASVFSDITDPSAFSSWNNASFNGSLRKSLRVSLRIEALGPLHEENDDYDSFELLLGLSSQDRAAFSTDNNDMPPQLAQRMSMKDRFEEIALSEKDKPMIMPQPCY